MCKNVFLNCLFPKVKRGDDGCHSATGSGGSEVDLVEGGGEGEQGALQPMVEVTEEIREEYLYDDDEFEVSLSWNCACG